jgi:hypothetical protein
MLHLLEYLEVNSNNHWLSYHTWQDSRASMAGRTLQTWTW